MPMRKKWLLAGTLISVPLQANSVAWFEQNTPLTQAHQYLLNNDLPGMFESLIEVWQQDNSKNIQNHLNELLLQSLNADCGKTLYDKPFPDWIKSVSLQRVDIQSPGRDAYQVLADVVARKPLIDISLTKWVDKSISTDSTLTMTKSEGVVNGNGNLNYVKRYNLNNKLGMGLYRLEVTNEDHESWSAWIILEESSARQVVRWASKDQWQIEKKALLNPRCPLPKLNVALYDYEDGKYSEVWNQSYESDYPTTLDANPLPSDRYVLAVSMIHHRWQGAISIEHSQVINKTYDVSADE